MHGFLQKQNRTQWSDSANLTRPGKAGSKLNHDVHPILQLQRAIGNQSVARSLSQAQGSSVELVQLKPQKVEEQPVLHRQPLSPLAGEQAEQSDVRRPSGERKKAELAFHTALHFNRTFTGFNPTAEPKENELSVIWWRVWNPGWETAPEHTNRFTLYKADRCSGCRYKEDEIMVAEILGESIDSIAQKGKYYYENSVLINSLEAGLYDAYVDLDVHNQVDEINEDNNTLFMSFTVRPP
jgi:CARDB